jgi:hypothetical protein
MRTTVELPDSLFKSAKVYAVEHDTTLKELIVQGLKQVIAQKRESTPSRRLSIAPIQLSLDSPLRHLTLREIKDLDAATDERLNEIYR